MVSDELHVQLVDHWISMHDSFHCIFVQQLDCIFVRFYIHLKNQKKNKNNKQTNRRAI